MLYTYLKESSDKNPKRAASKEVRQCHGVDSGECSWTGHWIEQYLLAISPGVNHFNLPLKVIWSKWPNAKGPSTMFAALTRDRITSSHPGCTIR